MKNRCLVFIYVKMGNFASPSKCKLAFIYVKLVTRTHKYRGGQFHFNLWMWNRWLVFIYVKFMTRIHLCKVGGSKVRNFVSTSEWKLEFIYLKLVAHIHIFTLTISFQLVNVKSVTRIHICTLAISFQLVNVKSVTCIHICKVEDSHSHV